MGSTGGQTLENSAVNWLDLQHHSPHGELKWYGFSELETDADRTWSWSLSSACRLHLPAQAGSLYYTFIAPIINTGINLKLDGASVRFHQSNRPWQEFSGKLELPSPASTIEFCPDRFNGSPDRFAPADGRPLALQFKFLKFVPGRQSSPEIKTRKICPYPFSKMEVYSPKFAPCCTWWLKPELAFEGNEGDPWNSNAAKALRSSVLDGSYRFCKLDICQAPLMEMDELERAADLDLPIAAENLAALRKGETEMPAGPAAVVVLADPRCNLACPSCRKGMIQSLTESEKEQVDESARLLDQYADSIQSLVLASNGEVFFSPYLRGLLKNATSDRYPNLKSVEILSNGILFDEKSYESLRPGSLNIRKAHISIDAGNAETYAKIRGGDWQRLQRNLEWIKSLRKNGSIENFRLNFVIRKQNYKSLSDFFQLAESLKVDEVFLSQVLPWTEAALDYENENIFEKKHPEYPDLKELLSELESTAWPFLILGNANEALK